MKGIRNKIMISFTLLVSAVVIAIIAVISWQSSQSIALESKTLGDELTSHVYEVVDGHNAIALSLLDAMKREVFLHVDRVVNNPSTIANLEKNQTQALVNVLKKTAKGGTVDYATLYDLKGNFQAAYPSVDESKLQQFNANFPLYQKGKNLLTAKDQKPFEPEIVRHPELLFALYGLQNAVPGTDALSVSSLAVVRDDFGDPLGFYIAGKILNGYTAPFEGLYQSAGASSALYLDTQAISFAGFAAKLESAANMKLNPEDIELIYKNSGKLRRTLTLAGEKYLSTCSTLTDGGQKTVGALCTGQAESKINATRAKVERVADQTKHTLQTWIAIVATVSFVVFVVISMLITRSIVAPLQDIVRTLGLSSEEIHTGAAQIASASQGLSDGASSQSASLEETASSLDEMTSMIHRSGENTDQAKLHMDNVLLTVKKTKDSMDEVHNSMLGISKSSEETSKIIKTIDEIAFQTNLLALNAAVEAARAGEAGAGFAVVADEVRSLALRATEAAKNTAALLEQSISKVKTGTLLVDATSADFQSVKESIETVARLIAEVAGGATEQSNAIKHIADAVHNLNDLTMSSTAHAEESAAISHNFTDQADKLNTIVSTLHQMINTEQTGPAQGQGNLLLPAR